LAVGTKIDIHNNGLLGDGKTEHFYLDVDRIIENSSERGLRSSPDLDPDLG